MRDRVRRADRRGAYRGSAAAAGFVTRAVYPGVASTVVGRPPAVAEFWTGLPIVTGLTGGLLAVLMLPNAQAAAASG